MPALPELLALVATWLAAALDLRSRRIPNWLSGGTAALGLGARAALALQAGSASAEWASLLPALGAGALLLLCFGSLAAFGLLGAGDAKLLGAVGLCVGLPLSLRVMAYVGLSGGALALTLAMRRGELLAVLRNLSHLRSLRATRVYAAPSGLHLFPFGSAIAIGTTWAVAGRYLPGIALF